MLHSTKSIHFSELYYFLLFAKCLRGPDDMASPAGFSPRAVVWRPCFKRTQRRGAARMRPKRPPPEKTFKDFSLVFYINLNCSKTNGRNSRTHVVSCSLTDQGLMWLFAIGCETIWLKHATLLAKLPMNADNTSWGVAWMKCKVQLSCKGV